MTDRKTPTQLERGYINPDEIVRVWKKIESELGVCSLGRMRDYFKRKGICNPVSGNPPTRQGILHALSRTKEGREIIVKASHSRYIQRPPTGWPEERWALENKRKELHVPKV